MIRNEYPEATAEEILDIMNQWNEKIYPEFDRLLRDRMNRVRVVPTEAKPGETIGLTVLISGEEVGGLVDEYFKDKDHLRQLQEIVARVTGRRVPFKVDRKEKITPRDRTMDLSAKLHFDIEEV